MSETARVTKPSGLKPPSKIARPCFGSSQKPAVPQTPKPNGASSSLKKLSEDLTKTKVLEEPEQSDGMLKRDHWNSTIGGNDSLWADLRRLSEAGVRRASDASVILTEDTDSFIIGDRIWVGGSKPGHISYIGETQFAPGDWAGVVLDEPIGKNDGSVGGVRYFQCENKKGVFSRLSRLTRTPLALPPTSVGTTNLPVALASSTPCTSPSSSVKGGSFASKSRAPSIASPPSPSGHSPNGEAKIGDRVIIMSSQGSKTGVLRYKGTTSFAPGEWCGVELDDPLGKNDGSVEGIRYFECEPMFGLFAPAQKVSRSPASGYRSSCQIHHTSTVKRHGSKESINSIASSVRTNTTRKSVSRPPASASVTASKTPVQDMSKAKQDQINQLLKERDLVREKMTKAAEQADQAEKQYVTLQATFESYRGEAEKKIEDSKKIVNKLENEKLELLSQLEDVQFRAEEESINKSDIEVKNDQNLERIKELEDLLANEKIKYANLEKQEQLEELLTKTKDELASMTKLKENSELIMKQELFDAKNTISSLETNYKVLAEKLHILHEKEEVIACLTDKYKTEVTELNRVINDYENKFKMQSDEIEKLKACLIEKIGYTDQTENENKKLTDHVNHLNEEMRELQALLDVKNSKYISELSELKQKFTEEMNLLGDQLKGQQITNDDSDKLITKLTTELEESKLKLTTLSEKYVNELQNVQEAFNIAGEDLSRKDVELSELLAKFAETEKENISLKENLNKHQTDLADQSDKLFKKDQEIINLKNSIDNSLHEKLKLDDTWNIKINEQKAKFDEINNCLNKAYDDLQRAEQEKNSYESTINEKLTKLEKDIETYANENIKLKALIELEKTTFDEQNKLLQQLKHELKQSQSNYESLQEEIILKHSSISELSNKLQGVEKECLLVKEREQLLQHELEKFQKMELEFGDCQRRLNISEERCSQLMQQKEKLENDISSLMNTSTDSSTQLSKLNNDLREKEKELEVVRTNFADKTRETENREQELLLKMSALSQENKKQVKAFISELEMAKESKDSIEMTLKEKISLLQQQLEEAKLNSRESETKVQILNESVNQKETSCTELNNKLITSESLVKTLQEKLAFFDEFSSTKDNELANNLREIANLKSEKKVINENLLKTISEKNSFEKKVIEQNNYIDKLSSSIQELNENNLKLTVQLDELNKKLSSVQELELQVGQLKETCDRQHCTVSEVKSKNEELLKTIDSQITEIKVKDELIGHLNANVENLTMGITSVSLEKDTYLERIKELQTESVENNKTVQHLESTCTELKKCKAEMDLDLTSLKNSSSDLADLVSKLSKDLSEKEKELQDLQESTNKTENTHKELEKLKEELLVRDRIKNDLSSEVEKLKQSLDGSNTLIEKYSEIEKALKEKLFLASEANNNIKCLTDEVEAKENKCKQLEVKVKHLESNLEVTSREKDLTNLRVKELGEKVAQLESVLIQRATEIETVTTSKNVYEKKLKEKEGSHKAFVEEINSLKQQLHNAEKERKDKLTTCEELIMQLRVQKDDLDKNIQEKDKKVTSLLAELDCFRRKPTVENNNANSNGNSNNFLEEREMAESQINFLNSIIVDLQNKNDELKSRLELLEKDGGIVPNKSEGKVRNLAPRLFCDICDMFDLHDTEDCPRQATESPPPVQHHHPLLRDSERPYCDICEVFGHDTANCDDGETY